jgi:hypothetical protein
VLAAPNLELINPDLPQLSAVGLSQHLIAVTDFIKRTTARRCLGASEAVKFGGEASR